MESMPQRLISPGEGEDPGAADARLEFATGNVEGAVTGSGGCRPDGDAGAGERAGGNGAEAGPCARCRVEGENVLTELILSRFLGEVGDAVFRGVVQSAGEDGTVHA